jgi:hypothetical protein
MRKLIVIVCLVFLASPARTTLARAKPVKDPKVQEAYLAKWRKAHAQRRDFRCKVVMTERYRTYNSKKVSQLEASGKDGLLFVKEKDAKEASWHILITPTLTRYLNSANRMEWVVPVSPPLKNVSWFGFLLPQFIAQSLRASSSVMYTDLSPALIGAEYRLDKMLQDDHHVYLHLKPKKNDDEFRLLVVTLDREDWTLRYLFLVHPNTNETILDYSGWTFNLDPPVTEKSLRKALPDTTGWNKLEVPPVSPSKEQR